MAETTKVQSLRPMCDLLDRESERRHTLMDFLEFLQGKGVEIAPITRHAGWAEPGLPFRHEDLVFEYLGIDPVQLENERRAILDALHDAS